MEEEGGPSEAVKNRPFECCLMEYGVPSSGSEEKDPDQDREKTGFGWERMYALFAICNALAPSRVDDNILNVVKERYGEQLGKMSRG